MAYTSPVEKPNCFNCSKKATIYVYNRFNARNGAYCTKCGEKYCKELNLREKEHGN